MRLRLCTLLMLVPALFFAQEQDQNYSVSTIYKTATGDGNVDDASKSVSISYYDGLGRPIQHIAVGQSPTGKNILTTVAYDLNGRQALEYLPFEGASRSLAFDPAAEDNTYAFYGSYREGTSNPYSQKFYEASPLGRVTKQAAPGDDWAGNPQSDSDHAIKYDYLFNDGKEIRHFEATTSWDGSLQLYTPVLAEFAKYPENSLYKNVVKDENWISGKANTSEEFISKTGKTILKRRYGTSNVDGISIFTPHDTYYIYDEYGNLAYVIPPLASDEDAITPALLDDLCYQYKYDKRNRLVEKKLPGKNWEFIVYNQQDRIALTGPAINPFNQSEQGWLFTKYEPLGRIAYTGYYGNAVDEATRHLLQEIYDSAVSFWEAKMTAPIVVGDISISYSNKIFPRNGINTLTVDYYDNYSFQGAPAVPSAVEGEPMAGSVVGLKTASWLRAITTTSSTAGETTAIFYDRKYRPVRMHKTNYLGGYTIVDSKLKFSGLEEYKIARHKRSSAGNLITIKEKFTYSDQDRLVLHTHQINGGVEQLMAENYYDALGQLMGKNVGNMPGYPLQKVGYKYNIRGWLTEINPVGDIVRPPLDIFKFKLSYNIVDDDIDGLVTPLFNGNISETSWQSNSDGRLRKYGYRYDEMNRLLEAYYQKPDGNGSVSNSYNESVAYDKNGNINSIVRNGELDSDLEVIEIDNLRYDYDPAKKNQLLGVSDDTNHPGGFDDRNASGDDYAYDGYGNLISDKNKDITEIAYNHLNLPTSIRFGDSYKIKYLYAADGSKLKKTIEELSSGYESSTEYHDGFQYSDETLDFFPTSEGYVKYTMGLNFPGMPPVSGSYNYVFHYKDHLGNVRLSYGENPSTGEVEIMEESHYYPFGLKHLAYNNTTKSFVQGMSGGYYTGVVDLQEWWSSSSYKYKYNGKEFQDELGLNLYDYGARNYDPAIGRWMNIDPLAEKFMDMSPFVYGTNNPIYFIDPDGMASDGWIKRDENGQTSMTYDPNVNNINEANAAGYTKVVSVSETAKISSESGSYSYDLNADGSVTNSSDGSNIKFHKPIVEEGEGIVGGAFQTGQGTKIYTPNIGNSDNPFTQQRGNIESMDFSSPFFITSGIFKALTKSSTVGGGTTVLEGAVKSNYQRFVSKIPANSKAGSSFQLVDDGNYLFQAISPGKVPGSSAVYHKWVNPQGETFKMLKTTFAPNGSIIHIKPK